MLAYEVIPASHLCKGDIVLDPGMPLRYRVRIGTITRDSRTRLCVGFTRIENGKYRLCYPTPNALVRREVCEDGPD